MHAKVLSVCEVNYDRNLVEKLRKEKIGDKVLKAKDTVKERVQDFKALRKSIKREKRLFDDLEDHEDR